MAKREKVRGIFCVEGDWSSDLADRASVLDMLEMLETVDGVPYIHEHVGDSIDAFVGALKKWRLKKYAQYSIAYFAPGSRVRHDAGPPGQRRRRCRRR